MWCRVEGERERGRGERGRGRGKRGEGERKRERGREGEGKRGREGEGQRGREGKRGRGREEERERGRVVHPSCSPLPVGHVLCSSHRAGNDITPELTTFQYNRKVGKNQRWRFDLARLAIVSKYCVYD